MSDHIVDNKNVPEWDAEGNPLNLLAAAEDAYEWMATFSSPSYRATENLKNATLELRKYLDEAQK